jgi:sugar O-acyltransferase (sialic acid O-acetyltransferase NeuD family)
MEAVNKLLLIGGGGHCKSVIDSLIGTNYWADIKIIDFNILKGTFLNSIEVIGNDTDLVNLSKLGYTHAFISIGSVGINSSREKIYFSLKEIGFKIPNIIDPSSIISRFSIIGEGSYIGKNVIINSNVTVGVCNIINTGSIIEHDCKIGDFVHIAPGSVLSGSVVIGDNTHVGTNTSIKNNITIGSNTVIGVGSVVVTNINHNVIAFGNPCREIK